MEALAGRVMMAPGGWVAGARRAGAEIFWTGRERPYDESTLRKGARALASHGTTEQLARAVEKMVEEAVANSGTKAIAFTDMYDQVYWTKKPAYAAPIANRGNRLLAATYFGMTFVQPKDGLPLAYHVSWHKPASPLQDGLEALYAAPRRAQWLTAKTRLHIWDRGGSGLPTLQWAMKHRVRYLTVSRKSARWTRFRRSPRLYTRLKVPVFVRRDAAAAKGSSNGLRPQIIIFPAHPQKGRASTRSLRYRTAASHTKANLRRMDEVYKARWPGNENPIKALIAVGFDRNLDRGLTLTTSRGVDGRLVRLEAQEEALQGQIDAFKPTTIPQAIQGARPLLRKRRVFAKKRAVIAAIPKSKGARMPTGAEPLCKTLMLLMYNVLALLLMRSSVAEVRSMTPFRVNELLLGRSFLTSMSEHTTTLWIDPVSNPPEHALQEELVGILNERSLSLRKQRLYLRIRDPPA